MHMDLYLEGKYNGMYLSLWFYVGVTLCRGRIQQQSSPEAGTLIHSLFSLATNQIQKIFHVCDITGPPLNLQAPEILLSSCSSLWPRDW